MSSIFLYLILAASIWAHEVKTNPANHEAVKDILRKNSVVFEEVNDFLLGIESTGNTPLNRISAGLNRTMKTVLVLNTSDHGKPAAFDKANFIILRVDAERARALAEWRDSYVKASLLHEATHAYLSNNFDKLGRPTPFAGILEAKTIDPFAGLTNPYYNFLSLQEFMTFPSEIVQMLRWVSRIEDQKKILTLSTTLENIAFHTQNGLDSIIKDLRSGKMEIRAGADKIYLDLHYVILENEEWRLSIAIGNDHSPSVVEKKLLKLLASITEIRSHNEKLREMLLGKSDPNYSEMLKAARLTRAVAKKAYYENGKSCKALL